MRSNILGNSWPAPSNLFWCTWSLLCCAVLCCAVLGVVVCRSLKLPPMLDYWVVGVLIGPNALAIAQDSENAKYLA